jgi:Domain of unknown function (DUF1906)/Fibronectin type III domain
MLCGWLTRPEALVGRMLSLEGHRVIDLRQAGHVGLAGALTVIALLVPHAGPAPADSPGEAISVGGSAFSTSVRPVSARSTGAQFVNYGGVRVTVPKTWPVIDLRVHPQTCVRFDKPVVYLGPAGSQSDCPAHAVGRVDTIWLRTVSAGRKDPLTSHPAQVGGLAARVGANPTGHDKHAQFTAQGVELEATWGTDPSSVDQVLATAQASPGPFASPPPTAPATTSTSTTPAATAVEPVAYYTATAAPAASSTLTGMAFDTCAAPTAATMTSWLASPYRAAGIYIGGSMRACGDGNLSSSWVAAVRSMGWGLMPIYVGAQAPCVNQAGLAKITASQAGAQGASSADDAVAKAQSFGLGAGTPIYYDMEAYNSSAAGCSQTVMTFISAWTGELHRRGYKSGAYGSTGSLMVDMSRSVGTSGFAAPDEVWFAHWNQLQTTSDSSSYPAFPDTVWSAHQRLHQYSGGSTQRWGGASVNIDANWVDAAVAGNAVPVNYGTNVVGPGGSGFVFTGSMTYWRPAAPAGLKGLAYWTGSNGSTEANGATWSPQLSPGLYDVEANIPATNATAKAPYTIRDALGTTTKVVNQGSISGYTSLGTHTARAGSSISVHVGDNDPSSTTTQIGVDAMAFRLVATAPSPPGSVRATGDGAQATISWSAANANGSPVTGYAVTVSPGGAKVTTTGATTATVTGLSNGTAHTFTVTATNLVGTSAASAPAVMSGSFTPLPTARVFDGTATTTPRLVQVAGLGGVPANATAVLVNTEVFNPTASGYVRLNPAGLDPAVATQEFTKAQTISNLVAVELVGGKIQVKLSAGSARILLDVSGYYSAGVGASFTPLPTARVFDGTATTTPRLVQIAGLGGVPANATAVMVNTEVFNPTAAGYVRVTQAGLDPGVAVQEFTKGQTISNLVAVKLVGGKIQVKVSAGSARILMDVAGYYSAGAGASFTPLPTARVFDGTATTTTRLVRIAGLGGVPANATAVLVNTEVFNPSTAGYVRVTPAGLDPAVAVQEFTQAQTISNLVAVQLVGGKIQVKVSAGSARVLMDISGYYAPAGP